MKKMLCLLLSLLLILSFAACGETEKEDTAPVETTEETKPDKPETAPPEQEITPLDSFFMEYKEADWEESYYLQANNSGDGTALVEYKTALGRKQASMPDTVMENLAQLYEGAEMQKLNGVEVYEEGNAAASIYIVRGEEVCSYNYYSAEAPEEFKQLFDLLAGGFAELMKDVAEYVPTPQMGEGLNETHSAEMLELLNNSGITALDSLGIMELAKDEYFAQNAGLSSADGIASGTSCTALMMTVPYSLVIVSVEEGADPRAVAADCAKNVDWLKWVCVQPSNGVVAVKDNMVLCLLGQDEMFFGTANALEEAGWTVTEDLKNPNL